MIWRDAQHDSVADCTPEAYEPRLALLSNIGFFVRLSRDILTLASCVEPTTGTARWFDDIPRNLVQSITPFPAANVPDPSA